MVEPWIVIPVVAGSSPVGHPLCPLSELAVSDSEFFIYATLFFSNKQFAI